jgi:hypothetical protein
MKVDGSGDLPHSHSHALAFHPHFCFNIFIFDIFTFRHFIFRPNSGLPYFSLHCIAYVIRKHLFLLKYENMSKNDATCQIHISKYLHLLQLYALIPVSVAGAERSFSILKLI